MRLPRVFLALAAVTALSVPAFADAVVYPTGDPGQDVPAVRAAVRTGGTVLLKAVDAAGQPQVFDFGTYPAGAINWDEDGEGYVALGTSGDLAIIATGNGVLVLSIGNDVHLRGETVDGAKTTIRGGTIPVRNLEPLAPGSDIIVVGLANLSVEGIRFTESSLQSVYLTQLGGVQEVRRLVEQLQLDLSIEIRGNDFLEVKPAFAGIWFGQGALADGPAGRTRIEGNIVRFPRNRWAAEQRAYEIAANTGIRPEMWEGLTITDLHGPGELSGNRVEGTDVGLHVWFGGADDVRIADNWLEMRPEAFYGIACEANHRYLIERNTIFAPGPFPDGISLWATDPGIGINHSTIRHNRVFMDGSNFGAITLYTGGSDNVFAQNVVEGSAAYAVGLASPFLPPVFFAERNTLRGNQTHGFTHRDSVFWGSGADFLFDANTIENVLVGNSGLVKDLGVGNIASGFSNRGRGPRATGRAAVAAKREQLRVLRPEPVERLHRPPEAPDQPTTPRAGAERLAR